MPALDLFDASGFDASLAATGNPTTLFRDVIKHANTVLTQQFNQGTPVASLVTHRAQFIDQILLRAWQRNMGQAPNGLALVAVGGYGRGELHPSSDIDLMVLSETGVADEAKASIERFLLFLWDIGLEVGHSVRDLNDCVEQANADITVATNLMESRLLTGPTRLYRIMRELTDQRHIWPGRKFFEAKWQEQKNRHHKFNDTAYNLEPNIKEGPGGLRDIQMIGWVAKRHFDVDTLQDLVGHGFLSPDEYEELDRGQNFLWKIRYGLHTLTGRREDRLLFDHQRTLAEQFGYRSDGTRLAVEYFMKDYYRTVMELERLNEMLLQLFQEEILYADDPGEPQPLNSRFQLRKGFIEIINPGIFQRYPFALLELFLVMAQNPRIKGVRAETIRHIRKQRYLINDEFRADLRNRSLFMELLRQPQGVTHQLRRMNRYGILAAYLPPFGNAVGQMQHDLFHVYTVDEHTLRVVRNLRRFMVAEHYDEFPLCSKLISTLPKPELLYIAGLYHDIAKGRGGDHSLLGAEEVERFCKLHQLSDYDTALVTWLIRYHLIMSVTAQRKDISDPEVINKFAAQVGDAMHLDYLYLLTVADIRATSPSVWNSWKDALLAELYHATRYALRRGLTNPIGQDEIIRDTREAARELLLARNIDMAAVEAYWRRVSDDYFLRYSADEIAWHSREVTEHGTSAKPLVAIRREGERGGTEIFIYTPIRGFQFTTTTHALDQLGLNVVEARIIPSCDNYTLDTYIVLEEDGEPIASEFRINEIRERLCERLLNPAAESPQIRRHIARQLKHFTIQTEIAFEQDAKNDRTIIEVITGDRPGVLSSIAHALGQCGIRLHNAKIATLGERVEDIFYVTDQMNHAISDEEEMDCLSRTLSKSLSE